MTCRGIPILYYGDEIGMANDDIPMKEAQDPLALQNRGVPKRLAAVLGIFLNRDDCRTPMQWSDGAYAGFSVNPPWLQPAGNYREVNVEDQDKDPSSLLSLYRALFALRKKHGALSMGKTTILDSSLGMLVYTRNYGDDHFVVALNFSGKTRLFTLDCSYGITLASDPAVEVAGHSLSIPPCAACVLAPGNPG